MKKNLYKTLFILFILYFQFGCEQKPRQIAMIITNDYLSERNLSFMGGPIPANYNKGLIDSLENSFVEKFENNNLIKKEFYNKIGALYYAEINSYSNKNRLEKTLEIDEFNNDTCIINYEYTDSLNLLIHKRISNSCKNEKADFYYQYNTKGEKTGTTVKVNDKLLHEQSVEYVSPNEKLIKSTDASKKLSTYIYKYNEKHLLVYEKNKEWVSDLKGDYFEKEEAFEYVYKYDQDSNWVERTKLKNIPKSKNLSPGINDVKHESSSEPEIIYLEVDDGIKEKLVRKIYYQ